ncbi:MAG: hypothetical protein NWR47_06115 [Aestuariivirgaceae bacterium]|nr:hypothetical protein [Aestuariivirgaceae bacterium]
MTNSKWLSALLAGTALTVASTAAFADTSMLTMTRNAAGEGVTFSISPTADMPAASTEVTISGELRALLRSTKEDGSDRETDLNTRARVVVKGKTDTSVGLVGAYVRFNQSNFSDDNNHVDTDKAYGYWEFSPGVTLNVGRNDSIASVVQGADWNGTQLFSGDGAGLTNASANQANVSFTSGPVAMTVGIEHSAVGSDLGVAANTVFSAGDFSAQLAGKSAKTDDTDIAAGDTAYAIGGGIGFSSGGFGLSVGAATGTGLAAEYVTVNTGDTTDDKFTAMSVLGTFNMTETTSLEAWYGTGTIEEIAATTADRKVSGYGAGVFWNPVSQLRLGAGAGTHTIDAAGVETDSTQIGVGAWFKF